MSGDGKTDVMCSGRVWHQGAFRNSPCSRRGIVERDGNHYCRQHDPVAAKARREEREAEWKAQWEAKQRRWKEAEALAALKNDALEAIRQIAAGHNDPRSLARDVLEQRPKQSAA